MFIQTEATPNPETLKFMPGRLVLAEGTASFAKGDSCSTSPLARRLLEIEGVEGVFYGSDFITITKNPEFDWYILKPAILGLIMENFVANLPVITTAQEATAPLHSDEDPISAQIRELIETRVRPAVAQDGGDITFCSFEEGVVYVKLQGACSGCPSSSATLKSGIESMLRYYVPEVLEVKAIDS